MPSNVTFKLFVDKMGGTDISSYIGKHGDLFYDPNTGDMRLSDGVTVGGTPTSNFNPTLINGGNF